MLVTGMMRNTPATLSVGREDYDRLQETCVCKSEQNHMILKVRTTHVPLIFHFTVCEISIINRDTAMV